ncbi:pyroglutamyl-peptidase 1-like protein [Platysternon megacephalum]|uniref:Pyroglutamyl-peptidase 1-like protein n=1 Tax=Platysternon megacephalum TaxID=55544 RepID=A0A4D9ES19_9SAUR|nr:pyroglutamyl-peptidase 1-like protein [Platysternon megacephalum]
MQLWCPRCLQGTSSLSSPMSGGISAFLILIISSQCARLLDPFPFLAGGDPGYTNNQHGPEVSDVACHTQSESPWQMMLSREYLVSATHTTLRIPPNVSMSGWVWELFFSYQNIYT